MNSPSQPPELLTRRILKNGAISLAFSQVSLKKDQTATLRISLWNLAEAMRINSKPGDQGQGERL